MPIPLNITRQHILQAIAKINVDGVPPKRGARRWALQYEDTLYPCKLVISWANIFANNQELNPNPNIFTTDNAQEYLTSKQFLIVNI
ncbi:MAG: hypothetical protein EOP51_06290 [Sphingobacteriales bacterium]|nr:MAG: hypothetical protein EOP51_06290 [Sphingobacteriales bacterium]